MARLSESWHPVRTDRILGIAAIVLSAGLFAATFRFPVVDWDPLGMAFWPRILIGLLFFLSLFFVVKGRILPGPPAKVVFRAFIIPAGGIVYVVALQWIGYIAASLIAMALLTRMLVAPGQHRLSLTLLMATTGTTLTYLVFKVLFGVYLPIGWLFQQ